jgi:6-phosphofructokinase 1
MKGIVSKIDEVREAGRNHALVVVAEGCQTEGGGSLTHEQFGGETRYGGVGQYLAHRIGEETEMETRVTVLGHVQRGGQPAMQDRLLASVFGVHAVDLVAEGRYDRMVAWQDRGVVDVPIDDVVIGARGVDPKGPVVQTARGLGIYVGEPT